MCCKPPRHTIPFKVMICCYLNSSIHRGKEKDFPSISYFITIFNYLNGEKCENNNEDIDKKRMKS